MSFTFGKISNERKNTCEYDIRKVLDMAISVSDVDFGIGQGGRTYNQQLDYFIHNKSKLDPRIPSDLKRAKHVISPERPLSEAVDIYAWVNGKISYDTAHVIYIAGIIKACSAVLYELGVISRQIRWGGNWDRDGEVVTDQDFDDLVHFELEER